MTWEEKEEAELAAMAILWKREQEKSRSQLADSDPYRLYVRGEETGDQLLMMRALVRLGETPEYAEGIVKRIVRDKVSETSGPGQTAEGSWPEYRPNTDPRYKHLKRPKREGSMASITINRRAGTKRGRIDELVDNIQKSAVGVAAADADEKRELENLIIAKAHDLAEKNGTNAQIEESKLWDQLYKRRRPAEEDDTEDGADDDDDNDGDPGSTMYERKRRKVRKAECASCGVKNDSDANFCKGCGKELE